VELGCQERNGNAPLTWIATTDTDFSSIDFLLDHSGSFAAQMTFSGADPGTAAEHGSFSTSSGTDLLGSEDLGNVNDYETGTIILNYNPPRFDLLEDTALNETVNFFLSVTGSGVTGTCSVMAEVVPT
jgi:hypothetical protein